MPTSFMCLNVNHDYSLSSSLEKRRKEPLNEGKMTFQWF